MRRIVLSFLSFSLCLMVLLGCNLTSSKKEGEQGLDENSETTSGQAITLPDQSFAVGDDDDQISSIKKALQSIGYDIKNDSTVFDEELKHVLRDFQSQITELPAMGLYNEETKKEIQNTLDKKQTIEPNKGFDEENISPSLDKTITVHNPNDILVLANKNHALPDGFEPDDLTAPNVRFPFNEDLPKRYIRKEAAEALETLFDAADEAGYTLYAQSGFRSYERQVEVFNGHTARLGEEEARRVSAVPGQSEHQTGLAMDITASSVGLQLTKDFGDTEEGKWVADNAHTFGFIIRYEEDKESITQYDYEPWHLRYVGKDVAKVIKEHDITLEQYLGAHD